MATEAFNWITNDGSVSLALAEMVAVWALETAETVAEKLALAAPAATVIEAGTVTMELLLARETGNPPVAAIELSVTVQASLAAPVIDPSVQVRPLNTGCPVPLRLIVDVVPVDELLVNVIEPLIRPAAVGANFTVSVAV